MAGIVAIANQKGGVGKTTTVHALGASLAQRGHRVLLVDLDPQACLTYSLGLDPEALDASLHDVIGGRVPADRAAVQVGALRVLPASIELAATEVTLLNRTGREYALARALEPLRDSFDVALLDCPPSLGILTINGLTAADAVAVPLQCETLSHRGVGQLMETIDDVRRLTNPRLRVAGILPTLFDGRTTHARAVLADLPARYGVPVLPPISRSIRFAEAPATGRSILATARSSRGAQDYRDLAESLDQSVSAD